MMYAAMSVLSVMFDGADALADQYNDEARTHVCVSVIDVRGHLYTQVKFTG